MARYGGTQGADLLRAVNSILQYQQERERSKVTQSLAMMQFGLQKRAADAKMAETQLAAAEKGNKQLQADIAGQWINASGLNDILALVPDSTGLEGPEISDELGHLADKLEKKQYGKFSDDEAMNIASALWTYRNSQDPTSIIKLAGRYDNALDAAVLGESDEYQNELLASFKKISTDKSILDLSRQASKSIKNQYHITQEYLEFAKGDFDIQSDIGVWSPEVQAEFQAQQPETQQVDYSNMSVEELANVIDEDVTPEEEIKGINVHSQGHIPMSSKQILNSIDYLNDSEKVAVKENLDKLTAQIKLLEPKISELAVKRQETLDLYDGWIEESEDLKKRVRYFQQIGDSRKYREAAKRLQELEYNIQGVTANEVTREREHSRLQSRGRLPLSRAGRGQDKSYTQQIMELSSMIRSLEEQREMYVQ